MTLLEQLDPERIGALYDRLGAKPVQGCYRQMIKGQLYCCPLGALAVAACGPAASVFSIDAYVKQFPAEEGTNFLGGYEEIPELLREREDPTLHACYLRGQELLHYLGGRAILEVPGDDDR
jgi:hypothetical protein